MLRRCHWWSLLLLNLNVIHTRSNWICWKAQEKFHVESRFYKTIRCSYVTLLATYVAKKIMFKVSNRNTRKSCLLISRITFKTSDRRHLTTSYLPEVTDQSHVLDSFSWNIYQFAIKSLLSVLLLSSTAHNFNNNWLLYVKFSETINFCRKIWLIENWKVISFYCWNKRCQKGQKFQFFKGQFLCNARTYGYNFWCVFRDLCQDSNKYNFAMFFKI